jgi:putative ABC transport system ATP-binding protein
MLELEDVVKRFHGPGEDVRAVDGVSLLLTRGEMLALEGPSGSGKTTLLLLIAGLLRAEAGEIRFGRRDLAALSDDMLSEYRLRDVGFIYQSFHLMPRVSVIENAAMKLVLGGTPMREARARALPWLERVGLAGRLEHTPECLSGGERQRVAIARALAAEPALILADEPTGNLDTARSREVVALLASIAHQGRAAVLLVTHDQEAGAMADRRCALRDGRLFAAEPHARPRSAVAVSNAESSGERAV